MSSKPLVTMLISPEDEAWVLAELVARMENDVQVQFDDGEDPDLYDQWVVEHPETPVRERRIRTLSARAADNEAKHVSEVLIDIITPHAREEDLRIRNGEQVPMTPDLIPWFAHTPLWED